MSTDIFRLAFFLGGLIVMFSAETLFPARRWQEPRKRRLFFHLALMIFNVALLRFPAVLPLLFWRQTVVAKGWGAAAMLGLKGPALVLATVVLFDLFDYWWHRFNHRVAFLWRFHKVHHVDTHVDITTSLRFHPGELMISAAFRAVWILIWGPSLWALVIFETSITMAAQFHHCNIDFPDGLEFAIRKLFVTPRYHAAHHTVGRRTGDANFSTIFIFWDKIFGTYRQPDYAEMQLLGLPEGRQDYLSFATTLKGPFTSHY